MTRPRKALPSRSGPAAPAPTEPLKDAAIAAALEETVERFRLLSHTLKTGSHRKFLALFDDFEECASAALAMASGTNLVSLAGYDGLAGDVGKAFVAELTSIGGAMTVAEFAASAAAPDDEAVARLVAMAAEPRDDKADADLVETRLAISEMERLPLPVRLALFESSPRAAALQVGAHMARNSDNCLFAPEAWTGDSLGPSLFVASLVSAVLSRVFEGDYLRRLGLDGGQAPQTRKALSAATAAAYRSLSPAAKESLGGYGVVGRIIEDALLDANGADLLDEKTAHRISAEMPYAFLAGHAGTPYTADDKNHVAALLLTAALAIGHEAAATSRPGLDR